MYTGKIVLSQLMKFVPDYEFQKCVDHYKGLPDTDISLQRAFFFVMSFTQLTGRESLVILKTVYPHSKATAPFNIKYEAISSTFIN